MKLRLEPPVAAPGSARDRVVRVYVLATALSALLFAFLLATEIVEQSRAVAPWWPALAVGVVFGIPILMGLTTVAAGMPPVRTFAVAHCVGYLGAAALYPLAAPAATMDDTPSWFWRMTALLAISAMVAFGPRGAIGYAVVSTIAGSLLNLYAATDPGLERFVHDLVKQGSFMSFFVWISVVFLRAADRLDEDTALVREQARANAASEARTHERDRFAALIHDGVLTTLLDASQPHGPSRASRAQAGRTLAELDELRSTCCSDEDAAPVSASANLLDILGLRGAQIWLLAAPFLIAVAYLLTNALASGRPVLPTVGTFVFVLVGGYCVVTGDRDPIPLNRVVIMVGAGALSIGCAAFAGMPGEFTGYTAWTAAECWLMLSVVTIRGRFGAAWVGAAVLFATVGVSAALAGHAVGPGLELATRPLATLLMVTAFASVMRSTLHSIFAARAQWLSGAVEQARRDARAAERRRQLDRLDRDARPLLELIACDVDLGAEQRLHCRLLEAELRDTLRAPQLAQGALVPAATEARRRGVRVVLLDDGGFAAVAPDIRSTVLAQATAELDSTDSGVVTVRVLPHGRARLATIMVSEPGRDRRTDIFADGRVRCEHELHPA